MKRFLIPIPLLSCCILLNSCGEAPVTLDPSLSDAFTVTAELSCGDTTASANLTRYGKDLWDAEFSEPDSLAGVLFSAVNHEITASYKGLAFSVPKSALPVKSVLTLFFDAVDDVLDSETLNCKQSNDGYEAEGALSEGTYVMTFDSSGLLLTFEMPNQEIAIQFTGYQELENTSESNSETDIPSETEATETASEKTESPST